MAIEVDINNVASIRDVSNINSNFQRIQTVLQDAVSRSGTNPNTMEADFDLNSNDLLNGGAIQGDSVTTIDLVTENADIDNLDVTEMRLNGRLVTEFIVEGPPGPQGIQGVQGDPGEGVPVGGTIGQVLTKVSSTDYDTEWSDPAVTVPFTAASASGPASLDFAEDTDNGVHKVTLRAPSAVTADRTVDLPDASGEVLLAVSPSIDNYVPRFDGTSGKLQSSVMRILDSGTLVANDDQNAYAIIAARFSSGFGGSAITTSLASTFLDFQVANTTIVRFNLTGLITRLLGNLSRGAPVTKTADFTVADSENWLINNKAGSACVVTLPAASSYSGREIMIKTIQAQQVNSSSSNVVPLAGGAAGTAILSASAGQWATLVSDGTNWIKMSGS